MFVRLGRFDVARRVWVLAGAVLVLVVSCWACSGLSGRLSYGGFMAPAAEATRAADAIRTEVGEGGALPGLVWGLVAVGHLLQMAAFGSGQHHRHGSAYGHSEPTALVRTDVERRGRVKGVTGGRPGYTRRLRTRSTTMLRTQFTG